MAYHHLTLARGFPKAWMGKRNFDSPEATEKRQRVGVEGTTDGLRILLGVFMGLVMHIYNAKQPLL